MEGQICVRSWRVWLLATWVMLQLGDVVTTYWGLSYPTIIEANPLMARVIAMPLCVIFLKATLTAAVVALLPAIESRTQQSSVPVLATLNLWMLYVCVNNSVLIAQASGLDVAQLATRVLVG